ncbi:zinc finger protein 883 isoform X3 [Amyelois transitella]|uniref:zinc finger protein 883 isoform X3 n=1 Tax=Amyelois transitella TaxID=680683 RepID=UPI00298F8FFC|nr:zinc finger protein 883 isoform X3 [Amyelois transitella]
MAAKSEWRPGPTVCRCCLTEGCYKDISTEYFWMGKREVYAEMLKDTLEVTIAYSKAGGPNSNSRLICESCISRLRDATEFKRQVVECERMFMQHLDPGSSSAAIEAETEPVGKIKVEGVKLEKSNSDDDFDNRHAFGDDDDDDDDDLDNQPLTKLASKMPTKESVDLLDLLDNSKTAEKRKSSTKVKPPPPKKAKSKVEQVKVKPSGSKLTPKPEKKKKGDPPDKIIHLNLPKSVTVRKVPLKNANTMAGAKDSLKLTTIKTVLLQKQDKFSLLRPNAVTIKKVVSSKKSGPLANIEKNLEKVKINVVQLTKPTVSEKIKRIKMCRTIICKYTTLCPFRFYRGLFECLYCKAGFLDVAQVEKHFKQHDSLSEGEIHKLVSKTAGSIKQFVKVNVREFGCKICGDIKENFSELKQHLAEEHNHVDALEDDRMVLFRINKNNYDCVHCGEKFVKYKHLISHTKEHYMNFFCDQCGTGFITASNLKHHMKSHESGSFPCTKCGKVYKNRTGRDEHHRSVHARNRRNVCQICRESFLGYDQKLKHMKNVHNADVPVYKCGFCPKVFLTTSYWKLHEKTTHLKTNCYMCDLCNYKHHNKQALKRHMIVHTGEKSFECNVCGKAYARRNTLREHLRIHNNERRFACSYCDRTFVQKCSLKGHVKTHHKDVDLD